MPTGPAGPEERPGELHPALLGRHPQRQRDRLLPPGAHAQPQPPADHSQSAAGLQEGAGLPAYLQRISAFRQALRSYTSCIFFTWVRGRGAWRDRQVGHVTKGGGPDRLYLLQEQRQELHQLVGGEGLHVGLAEGAQVLLLRLRGVERVRAVLQL